MAHFVTLDLAQNRETTEAIPLRFLTVFGMTLCVRLLHGVYTERSECVRNDRLNAVASYRELSS